MAHPGLKLKTAGRAIAQERASPAAALDHFVGDQQFMQSLARGLLALGAVAKGRGQTLTPREIATRTGLSVASARRCCYTLNATGYVRSNRAGVVAGAALAELAADYAGSSPIITHCGPILDSLRDEVGELVSLAMFDGDQSTIVATANAETLLKIDIPVGTVLPLYSTAGGRILLAHLPEDALKRLLLVADLKAHTERSITSPAKLREELADVRRRGFAIANQELMRGICTIGVPVRDARGTVIGSIGAVTLASAVSLRDLRTRFAPALMRAAARLTLFSA